MVSPSREGGVQVTLILVGPPWTAIASLGGEAPGTKYVSAYGLAQSGVYLQYPSQKFHGLLIPIIIVPAKLIVAESDDG